MRVLFCTNAFATVSNGPAKFANILAGNRNPGNGHEIRILTEDCTENSDSVFRMELRYPAFLKPFSQFFRMYQYHRTAMRIRKFYPFDVLVYNNALVGFISMLLFDGTVGMINDYTNATWKDDAAGRTGEKSLKRRIFSLVEKWFCRWSERKIITNSQYLSEILSSVYQVSPSKFCVLHKGIEEKLLQQNRRILAQEKVEDSILFVKTNYMLAGFSDLADAVKLLRKPIRLTVAGPPKEHHDLIRDMFSETEVILDLRANQSQEEVFNLMKSHKVFCLPSHKEAFGVSVLEALSFGCRVVATNVGGIPEAAGTGPWQFLCPAGNPTELARQLTNAFQCPDSVFNQELEQHLENFRESKLISSFFEVLGKQ
jgi:glycosyltransferase involved in cell wall biosynthesis